MPRRRTRRRRRGPSVRGNVGGGRRKRRRHVSRVPQRRNGFSETTERTPRGLGRSCARGSFASDMSRRPASLNRGRPRNESWKPVRFASDRSWSSTRLTRISPWRLAQCKSDWIGCWRASAIASIAIASIARENYAPRGTGPRLNGENAPRRVTGRQRMRTLARWMRAKCAAMPWRGRGRKPHRRYSRGL